MTAREVIAKTISEWESHNHPTLKDLYTNQPMTGITSPFDCADKLLSLTYPNGKPMLAILDEEQKLPENPYAEMKELEPQRFYRNLEWTGYIRGQQDMKEAGWVKGVKPQSEVKEIA